MAETPTVCMGLAGMPSVYTGVVETPLVRTRLGGTPLFRQRKQSGFTTTTKKQILEAVGSNRFKTFLN